jgi:hypothetical protein
MKMKVWMALALLVACTSVVADEPKKEMPADQKAMMEAMMKAMTPGEPHKLLDNMVGTFDAKVSSWMQPGAPPMVSTGTSVNSWILGGRFVEQKFAGSFMGQPFNGIGYTGYDNVKKQYWGSWVDTMSTGVMMSTGSTSDNGKTWKFTASMPDPMTGKDAPMEERVTVTDKDHHLFEMWSPRK